MNFSIFSDFLKYLNEKFQGEIPNLLFFLIGLGIGIVLFFLLFIIVLIIARPKQKIKEKILMQKMEIQDKYKDIINESIELYKQAYEDCSIKEKVERLGKIILKMMEKIASLYYPNSADPIFEISLDQLIEFINYMAYRLNFIVDSLLQEKLKLVEIFTPFSIKYKKLSFIFEMIENNKNKEAKKETFANKIKNKILNVGKKVASKIGENILDEEIVKLIFLFGEDINKLYCGEKLVFSDLTKKELKEQKKLLKKCKRSKKNELDL